MRTSPGAVETSIQLPHVPPVLRRVFGSSLWCSPSAVLSDLNVLELQGAVTQGPLWWGCLLLYTQEHYAGIWIHGLLLC